MLSSWLHLTSLALFLGSMTGLWLTLLPARRATKNPEEQTRLLALGLKFFNPLQIGALGMLVLSGALQLTHVKAVYRELFVKELGLILGVKLTLSFFLILLSVYQSMAVANRFVRRFEGGESFSVPELQLLTRRLRALTAAILLLAAATALAGVRMRTVG